MRKFAIAAVAVLAIAGSTAVYAQHRHWGSRPFADESGGQGGLCRRADRSRSCRPQADGRPGKAVAAGRDRGAGSSPSCGSIAPMRG